MLYINAQGEYPRHYGDIQLENLGWQLGDELPTGWIKVEETVRPTTAEGQIALEVFPVETDGVWSQAWSVRDLTADEIKQRQIAEIKLKLFRNQPITEQEALLLVG